MAPDSREGPPDPDLGPNPKRKRPRWPAEERPVDFQRILQEARERLSLGTTIQQVRASFDQTMDEEFPQWRRKRRAAIRLLVTILLAAASVGLASVAWSWVQKKEAERQREIKGRVIDLIDPLEPVREEQITFAWRPSPISSYYRVELLDPEYRRIWTNGMTSDVETELPGEIRKKLKAGEPYYWQVRGFDENDHEVSRSAIQEFRILR